ncbi:MAG: quinone-interacting membrane-bound oxidoreductase complex subunit QmoC [Candidatus Zixiibacteriota bacterium]
MAATQLAEPDLQLIREVRRAGGDSLKKCFQCATCSVICNLSPEEKPFPRKEMIWAQWGQREKLAADPDVWLCHQCNDCSTYCPREARPGDVLAAVRSYLYRFYSFPQFMGRALANPSALPILFLVPIVILLGCILLFAPQATDGGFLFMQAGQPIDFNIFLPHNSVDALFVTGNIIIFLFAAIGFSRFWRTLQKNGPPSQISFWGALWATLKEFLVHTLFNKCDANRPRAVGHMILFFGFAGAMVTTGCVFVFVFAPHYLHLLGLESIDAFFTVPIDLPHPVKILGALSGVAVVVGGGILVVRRWTNKDNVGANGYPDYLFLYVIFFAGLTGMASWLTRYSGVPLLAYISYFIHLVFVFVLLWYMPYSKFAHMFYRTLALTHARRVGRRPRE